MSDLVKRSYGGELAGLQSDVERASSRLRKDIDDNAAFTPADEGDWAGTPPATVKEATDRLAYHIRSGGGNAPILELP